VQPGTLLLLDDGLMQLEVDHVENKDIHTRVLVGGLLKDQKGINLPGVKISAPALTKKDREDLEFGLDQDVDFVALSFVRSAADVREAVRLATRGSRRVPVIAKIEKPEAVDVLDEIVDVADGVMVARGDLGVELGPEKVPLVQKRAIEAVNARGKVVITATQMLESMMQNPRPTRAEASDVANAVLDGSDALMLSGETAAGRYPLLAVRTMARIIEEIEASARFKSRFDATNLDIATTTNAICKSAVVAARQMGARAIVCVSESGGAPRLLSDYRPESLIVALTSQASVYRQMALYWGILPISLPPVADFGELLQKVSAELIAHKVAHPGDIVALTVSAPLGAGLPTNALHLHRL
jgi:pyruvate kinase